MNFLQYRPGAHAGPLAFPLSLSILLHLALLAWLHPRSSWQLETLPRFDIHVRIAAHAAALPAPMPKPAARRKTEQAAPRPGPLPPPADPVRVDPLPPQPLRMRVVANPADYNAASSAPGRPYAWPGVLTELPFPTSGFQVRYPEEELRKGEKALVVVRADISSAGGLEKVDVICGASPFDVAVLEALRAAPFRPPLSRSGPVPVWTVLEFAFLAEPSGESASDPLSTERALEVLQKDCPRPR